MSNFIPGLELCRLFYLEAVKPVLDTFSRSLQYSAALIGSGSEILGFDTEMSADHHWGPRVMLFLKEDDHHLYAEGSPMLFAHLSRTPWSTELPTGSW